MYPVSELYKSKIKELNRFFKIVIEIQHSQGVLILSDKDIVGGTLIYNESSQSGEEFTVGATVASTIEFEILNKPEYENISFMGATVIATVGLETIQGMNLTFEDLKQYTFEELKQFTFGQLAQDIYEYVPLGRFNIDEPLRQRNTIKLKAIDNMIELEKPYKLSNLGYPATLYQIYVDACNMCDVQVGTTSFPNMDYVVQEKSQDLSFRDIIGYIAELSGTFARFNRTGSLEFVWYKNSGIILEPSNRFNFKASDDLVQIKGVMTTVDDTTYLAGSDEYVVDLSENPLLQGNYETVLPNILNNIKDTVFVPFESSWQGNPAMQAGDIIVQTDRDGNIYNTLITHSTYKYRGASTLIAKGLPAISKSYKGSTNKKIAEIKRLTKELEKDTADKLTTLEQAQLNATQLIASMLGGYAIRGTDAFYVADSPDLAQAQKVWKWGIGGFGYSSTGVDGPYTAAITADGSIVAMLVAANIITANMINTGLLRSVDGSTWINLDDGTFSFKNVLKFEDNKLILDSPDIPTKSDLEEYAPKVSPDGLVEISPSKGFLVYKDATKQEFAQLYDGGAYRVAIDTSTGQEVKREYFYERALITVGEWGYDFRQGDDGQPEPTEAEVIQDLNCKYFVQLTDDFKNKPFKIKVNTTSDELQFFDIPNYQNYLDKVFTKKMIIKIEDTQGNVWDGKDSSTMPTLIKTNANFYITGYVYYEGENLVDMGGGIQAYVWSLVATKFKMDLDITA
ncbi:hypothetical protein [Brassicibacter mesophilus]|uniref:hypothetical protein n=1 Tax=Brassicibacter mesophilus TaxID=745119 RepID=UPI003D2390AF